MLSFVLVFGPGANGFLPAVGHEPLLKELFRPLRAGGLLARVLGILAAGVRHLFLAGVGTGEGIVLCPPFSWRGSAHFVCIGIPAAGQFGRSLQETIPAKRKFQPHQTGAGPAQIGRFQGGQIIVGHPLEARVRALAGVFFSARVSKAASFKKPPPLASPRA